ncbi:MAG: hypothetical protein LBF51_02540, partial [Zoogloeaceae bacterium]|nr:hypothetical protein [Zoogloeaceae bacterium]
MSAPQNARLAGVRMVSCPDVAENRGRGAFAGAGGGYGRAACGLAGMLFHHRKTNSGLKPRPWPGSQPQPFS